MLSVVMSQMFTVVCTLCLLAAVHHQPPSGLVSVWLCGLVTGVERLSPLSHRKYKVQRRSLTFLLNSKSERGCVTNRVCIQISTGPIYDCLGGTLQSEPPKSHDQLWFDSWSLEEKTYYCSIWPVPVETGRGWRGRCSSHLCPDSGSCSVLPHLRALRYDLWRTARRSLLGGRKKQHSHRQRLTLWRFCIWHYHWKSDSFDYLDWSRSLGSERNLVYFQGLKAAAQSLFCWCPWKTICGRVEHKNSSHGATIWRQYVTLCDSMCEVVAHFSTSSVSALAT